MDLYKNTAVGLLFALCLNSTLVWASPSVPAEYQDAAEKIVAGFNARDPDPFVQAIDAERILDTALSGLFVGPKRKEAFSRGINSGINTGVAATRLIRQMPEGGYAKLLRIKMVGDTGYALVRVDLGELGLGYMDMHLSPVNNGEIKIVDWFSYGTGQLYTETLRHAVTTISPTPTLLGKVYDITTNRKENADMLMALLAMHAKGEHEQMVRKFLSLDESLRKSRLLNIIAFQSANVSNDMELYRKVLENMARYFSTEEGMSLILMDYYYLEGNYDMAIKAIDRVQTSFGVEDAGMIVYKANVLVEMGKSREAVVQARRAIELEPEFELAYLSLLSAQVEQKQYAQAVDTADTLEKRFYYDFSPQILSDEEFYAGFLKSAEYREWRSGR